MDDLFSLDHLDDSSANGRGNVRPESEETVVRGRIDRISFRNPENGYTVLRLIPEGGGATLTVVGNNPALETGATVVARGIKKEHPKYGEQLVASSILEFIPSTREELERYLASGVIKGIGEVLARRIAKETAGRLQELLKDNLQQVANIKGVGQQKAELLRDHFVSRTASGEAFQFLIEKGLSTGLAGKLIEKYGVAAPTVVKEDPYRLAYEVDGVGFLTADSLALRMGVAANSEKRIGAGMHYTLRQASEDGHCYLLKDELRERTNALLGSCESALFEIALTQLQEQRRITLEDDQIYLTKLHKAELALFSELLRRATAKDSAGVAENELKPSIAEAEAALDLRFSSEQLHAVHQAFVSKLLVITGGPGCGKTTVIRALATVAAKKGLSISLAAPTGRAAQRMSQVCGLPACTIHRLLAYNPFNRAFTFNEEQQLECDLIIIDESSMIDLELAAALFAAIPKTATVVLVGDKDQLPSVGPGRVFADIVRSPDINTIALSRLFRRSESSIINTIALEVNAGITPEVPTPDGQTKVDAYFLEVRSAEEGAALIEKLVAEQLPRKFGFAPDDMLVLTPMNRGVLGTEGLNQRLQERLNPPGKAGQELIQKDRTFRVGDRVCQRVNNYNIDLHGVFNGDFGNISKVDTDSNSVEVDLWDGRTILYPANMLRQLNLAYAITIHRSQGSEIPCVILALHTTHFTLLERQLLYTAITRAKKLLVIVGNRRALELATNRSLAGKRNCRLHQRLTDYFENRGSNRGAAANSGS